MDLEEYRSDYLNEIAAQFKNTSTPKAEIFLNDVCSSVLIEDMGLMNDSILTYQSYKYDPSRPKFKTMAIDASSLELAVQTLNLIYCDFNDGEMTTFNNEDIKSYINGLTNYVLNVFAGFYNLADPSSQAAQLAFDILENQDDFDKVRAIIVSTNKMTSRVSRNWTIDPIEVRGHKYKVEVFIIDFETIFNSLTKGSERDKIDIYTDQYGIPEGIRILKANIENKDYDSYLAVIPGKFLADIYEDYSSRLLESNVRSFLSTRGKINKEILNTILNEPTMFFAYNNGIATTADSIEFNESKTAITCFKNLQIINGGQTTASLASAVLKNNADLTGIYVQMKLSVIKNKEKSSDIIRDITKYANRQNKVTNADLNSNHKYFIRIEELSRRIKTPPIANSVVQTYWFFERARGQYEQERARHSSTEAAKRNFDLISPKHQKFTKTDLAKYIEASDCRPYNVAHGGELCLTAFQTKVEATWDKNNDQYNDSYFQDLVAKKIMYDHINSLVEHTDWYKDPQYHGYKSSYIPYIFAKFVDAVTDAGYVVDYGEMWNKQSPISQYDGDLLAIADLVRSVFYSENRDTGNILEWTKRENCWNQVQKKPYRLSQATISHLKTKEQIIDKKNAARSDQRVTNSAANIVQVWTAGADYWKQIVERDKQIGFLTGEERLACQKALDYCQNPTHVPMDRDLKILGQVMQKAEQDYHIYPPDGK